MQSVVSASDLPVLCIGSGENQEGDMLFLDICFPFLSIWDPEEFSSKCFFPSTRDEIQGLEHAKQVCHQLSYTPSPSKSL